MIESNPKSGENEEDAFKRVQDAYRSLTKGKMFRKHDCLQVLESSSKFSGLKRATSSEISTSTLPIGRDRAKRSKKEEETQEKLTESLETVTSLWQKTMEESRLSSNLDILYKLS